MRLSHPLRSLSTASTLLVVLGLAAVQARRGDGANAEAGAVADPPATDAAAPRGLDAGAVTVRLLLGVGGDGPADWGGKVAVDKGELVAVDPWRFRQGDAVGRGGSWDARTRPSVKGGGQAKKKQKQAAAKKKGAILKAPGANATAGAVVPNGVFVTLRAPEDARLSLETRQGNVAFPLADLAGGAPRRYLDGKVEAQVVPTAAILLDGPDQEDFPAAAAAKGGDGRGAAWVAFVAHKAVGPPTLAPLRERPKDFASYVPKGGGDQVKLFRFADGKAAGVLDVTGPGRDVWRASVAVDGEGKVVVVWSENVDGNWDLYRRTYHPDRGAFSEPARLTRGAGTDTDAVLATAPDGKVWMAWQGWTGGNADILLATADDASSPAHLGDSAADEWSPSIAIDRSGQVHVAYDTYRAGNFDVQLRTRGSDGTLGPVRSVAATRKFEARPSVAADPSGRVWVAYEERTEDWGKDAENLQQGDGTTLYRSSAVRVRCLDGQRRLDAPDPLAGAPAALAGYNSFPRLAADSSGRIWLAYRHRQEARASGVGGAWVGQVVSLEGPSWTPPAVLAGSDGMLDSRASLVAGVDGPPLAFYAGDARFTHDNDALDHGLRVAALVPASGRGSKPAGFGLAASAPDPVDDRPPLHPDEAGDIARLRAHRVVAGGKTYRLLRGEFHRHTEISTDGGNDGALEDLWRYALDCANLDWIGNGDHDNGGGKEYTWWLVQKTTDLYHTPSRFTPMFTYERSVQYPHGHRNVMWDRRGIRTLPRLQAEEGGVSDDDTKMLYDYLKELGGICSSHTSGTATMGTDWRDNDPAVEPIVEMFQGHRNSYEYLGAPRAASRPAEAIAGMQPYGMIWNALGLQYKLGFQSSSDHISTHISYGVALAEDHSRAAILDAFKRRHCYAATDNILMDVRSGEHLMGDEFDADGPVRLKVLVHGNRPISRVDIIKDFGHVYTTEPRSERVAFEWTDEESRDVATSWYYVRAIQDNGELAWASPMWVHRKAARNGPAGD